MFEGKKKRFFLVVRVGKARDNSPLSGGIHIGFRGSSRLLPQSPHLRHPRFRRVAQRRPPLPAPPLFHFLFALYLLASMMREALFPPVGTRLSLSLSDPLSASLSPQTLQLLLASFVVVYLLVFSLEAHSGRSVQFVSSSHLQGSAHGCKSTNTAFFPLPFVIVMMRAFFDGHFHNLCSYDTVYRYKFISLASYSSGAQGKTDLFPSPLSTSHSDHQMRMRAPATPSARFFFLEFFWIFCTALIYIIVYNTATSSSSFCY